MPYLEKIESKRNHRPVDLQKKKEKKWGFLKFAGNIEMNYWPEMS